MCPNGRIRYNVLRRSNPCPRDGRAWGVHVSHLSWPLVLLPPQTSQASLCHVSCLYLSCVLWLENSSLRLLNQWPSTLLQGKYCPGYSGGTKGKMRSGSIDPGWTVMWGPDITHSTPHAASTTVLRASTETSVSWSVHFKGDSHQHLKSLLKLMCYLNVCNLKLGISTLCLNSYNYKIRTSANWEFPGGPVIRLPCFHCSGPKVQALVGELRSSKLGCIGKKKQNYTSDMKCKAHFKWNLFMFGRNQFAVYLVQRGLTGSHSFFCIR